MASDYSGKLVGGGAGPARSETAPDRVYYLMCGRRFRCGTRSLLVHLRYLIVGAIQTGQRGVDFPSHRHPRLDADALQVVQFGSGGLSLVSQTVNGFLEAGFRRSIHGACSLVQTVA